MAIDHSKPKLIFPFSHRDKLFLCVTVEINGNLGFGLFALELLEQENEGKKQHPDLV